LSGTILAEKLGRSHHLIFVTPHTITTNLTQHDSHGPDEQHQPIEYHCMNIARDDGMDENGIDWLYGCCLIGFNLKS
jgi:hypothetical protein